MSSDSKVMRDYTRMVTEQAKWKAEQEQKARSMDKPKTPQSITSKVYEATTPPMEKLVERLPPHLKPSPEKMPVYPFRGAAAGAVATVESYFRPDVPTPLGATIETIKQTLESGWKYYPGIEHLRETIPWMATKTTTKLVDNKLVGRELIEQTPVYENGEMIGIESTYENTYEKTYEATRSADPFGSRVVSDVLSRTEKMKYYDPSKVTYTESSQVKELQKLGAGYVVGSILSDVVIAYISGKALGKVISKYKSVRATAKRERYFRPIAGPVEQWGEDIYLQPGAFDFSQQFKKVYKYTGYPVIQGQNYAVVQVTKPSAWVQVQRAIERGVFPWSGQHPNIMPVFERAMSLDMTSALPFLGHELTSETFTTVTPYLIFATSTTAKAAALEAMKSIVKDDELAVSIIVTPERIQEFETETTTELANELAQREDYLSLARMMDEFMRQKQVSEAIDSFSEEDQQAVFGTILKLNESVDKSPNQELIREFSRKTIVETILKMDKDQILTAKNVEDIIHSVPPDTYKFLIQNSKIRSIFKEKVGSIPFIEGQTGVYEIVFVYKTGAEVVNPFEDTDDMAVSAAFAQRTSSEYPLQVEVRRIG